MATRSTNTLPELLQKFLADLGQFKMVASDSDLATAVQLETNILQMARKPIDQVNQQGLTNAPPPGQAPGGGMAGPPGAAPPGMGGGGMPPGMMPPNMPPGMPGGGNMGAPGPTPGTGPRMPMPSLDELRRMLGSSQATREARTLARQTQG